MQYKIPERAILAAAKSLIDSGMDLDWRTEPQEIMLPVQEALQAAFRALGDEDHGKGVD